jgi:hypothetical protein
MVATKYRPDQHELVEGPPGVRHLRDRFNDPLLFMYRHKRTGNFLIAAWVDQKYGRMQELVVVGRHPVIQREHVARIARMVPGTPEFERGKKAQKHQLRTWEKHAEQEDAEVMEEGQDAFFWMAERGIHKKRHYVVNGPIVGAGTEN